MDNCKVHKNSEVIAMIESVGAVVLFLPAYSPSLNPVSTLEADSCRLHGQMWHGHWTLQAELVFAKMKAYLRRHFDLLELVGKCTRRSGGSFLM